MLLNIAWLIPALPIITSFFIAVLLFSFSKTMNRLTKPVSYLFIISIVFSELINFILFKANTSDIVLNLDDIKILKNNFQLVFDHQSLLVSLFLGFVFLLIMLISLIKLKRQNGYVRYFILLGFLAGFLYLFTFSGSIFHNVFDPFISVLDQAGISIFKV